jgi:hypothetical protein
MRCASPAARIRCASAVAEASVERDGGSHQLNMGVRRGRNGAEREPPIEGVADARSLKVRRRNPNDADMYVTQVEVPSQHGRIGLQVEPPEAVTQDQRRRRIASIIGRRECPAAHRNAQGFKPS